MDIVCKKVVLFSKSLEKYKEEIVFIKGDKIYEGALFFPLEKDNVITKVIKEETIKDVSESLSFKILEKVFDFYLNNCSKKYSSTLSTMKHWQYINGFSNCMF